MLVITTKTINISTVAFYNFLKLKTSLRVLFVLTPVNKDLESAHIWERKKFYLVHLLWKKSVVFGSNSLKISIPFRVVLFGSNSPKMSVLFNMKSDKKCLLWWYLSVVLYYINPWRCQNFFIWTLKLSNYCFLSLALVNLLKQRSFIVIRKKLFLNNLFLF